MPKEMLGRYQLLHRLATGGMAEIFLACERGVRGLERIVVVKRILPHLAIHDVFVEMFLQEARFIARLSHPNIVQIFELGEADGAYFLAMEYVPGVSLRELMRAAAIQKKPVPLDVCVALMAQACAGAHAAHELCDPQGKPLGLVHRDISPHNLMVTGEGHVKLLDFGIAKATEVAMEHTRTGALKGKIHYMSPEQCRQDALDRRSDLFALGIVLWELFTARRLFKREGDLATMQAIVTGDVWDVRQFRPEVPAAIAEVVDRALATDPDDRFATADEMKRALMRAAEDAGLAISPDVIAPFVQEVLKDRLEEVREVERAALEKTRTGPLPEEEPTIIDRKTSSSRAEKGDALSEAQTAILEEPGSDTGATGLKAPARRRRPLLFAAAAGALVVLGLLAAFLGQELLRRAQLDGPPLKIGMAPVFDPAEMKRELEPLRRYLEDETKRPVEYVVTRSYEDLQERFLNGEVPFASMPPYLYISTKAKEPNMELLAFKLADGSSINDGVLLAREGSGIREIGDARGKVLCYTDENSTTGYMQPRHALRQAGIDPDKDLAGTHRSGDHLQLLRDLNAGMCDLGGTYSGNYHSAAQKGISVSRLRVITITGRSPQDAIVAGPFVDPKDKALLRRALLAFDAEEDLGLPHVGQIERINGFAKGSDDDYTSLRKALEEEGRSPERPTKETKEAPGKTPGSNDALGDPSEEPLWQDTRAPAKPAVAP